VNSDSVQLFSALLGVGTLMGGLVTGLALLLEGKATWAASWLAQVRASGLWIMCAITTGAMVGSLYFSESVGYAPCKLCWYQRIGIYSIAIITFVAALRRDKNIGVYSLVLACVGLVVSTYHYLLEWFPQLESNVCSIDVPCTTVWFRELGFVTLCFMAGSAFIAVISISLALMRESLPAVSSTASNDIKEA
jgi:disulfide bond formation protein DsbB